jgi:tRNA-modifying protein YgfZ
MAVQTPPELESQYRVLHEGAGMLDRSERGKLDVAGPDAQEYLHGQVTNEVEELAPGEGCYAALLNPKGRILADMRVLARAADQLWIDTEADALEVLRPKLDMYRIGRRVELTDRTNERAILSLIGPRARAVAGIEVPEHEHHFAEANVGGVPVVAAATDLGVDLVFDRDQLEAVHSALTANGAVAVAEEAAEIVRIEGGRPRHGVDMTDDNLPAEVGIEQRAVSFTKGCYVGQEPVARMHYRGHPNRHLRGLTLVEPASADSPLVSGDNAVGRVTSACISPALGPIALALVRREVEPGQEVGVGDAKLPARVVELPFFVPGGAEDDRPARDEVDRLG